MTTILSTTLESKIKPVGESTRGIDNAQVSIILPAKNEAASLRDFLPKLRARYSQSEIVVVDDGSTDETAVVCGQHGVRVIRHPYSLGNGAAIKTAARAATGKILVFMDADGQHDPDDLEKLLELLDRGYEMVVGARVAGTQASAGRSIANKIYNRLASYITGHRIVDLTSGFRVADATKFKEFIYLLPNGFSYPTTITMSFLRAGYPIGYVPIRAIPRVGRSHINPIRDGIRFLLIIFRVGTLYSPLKVFVPMSLMFFFTALLYYLYTFVTEGRFTNMSALLFTTSLLIFLIGLVSEQITNLLYSHKGNSSK